MKVSDLMPEFIDAMRERLDKDQKKWGDTWLYRTREGQEERIENAIKDYYDRWRHAGEPIPWLKIVGNCMIAWIREEHSDLFPE